MLGHAEWQLKDSVDMDGTSHRQSIQAIADGETSLGQVPLLLRKVLENDAWKEFETKMGKHVAYTRFEDFVSTPPLDGLGADMELIKKIASKDIELQELLAKALRDTHGGDRKSENTRGKIKESNGLFDFEEKKLKAACIMLPLM